MTPTIDGGLRTHSGGQYSIEVEGFLAIENGVTPDLVVEATHAARDVFAVVRQAPAGGPIEVHLNQNGVLYCTLTIAAGSTNADPVDGFGLPPLLSGARLSADITQVGTTAPGADLTVIVRL